MNSLMFSLQSLVKMRPKLASLYGRYISSFCVISICLLLGYSILNQLDAVTSVERYVDCETVLAFESFANEGCRLVGLGPRPRWVTVPKSWEEEGARGGVANSLG